MSRQSLNKRFSRHGRSSTNLSGIVNPDSNIIDDDDNPLWWRNLDGDSIMARRSMRLSTANRASSVLDSESRIESFELSKEWWKKLDDTEFITSKDRNDISKNKNESSVQGKDTSDIREPPDVSNKEESIYKKKHALLASKKRKSHGTSNFLNILNETSMTVASDTPATRSRKEIVSDNSYLSYNEGTSNKYKGILRNRKRLSGHGSVNDTEKRMKENSLNQSNKRINDSSGESNHNDGHVIKSKRILRITKNKETTENVFDNLLSEYKSITPKRSIDNIDETEDSFERSIKKSRLNIFKKKRISLSASMIQKAMEDDTMEESDRRTVTAENDPASNLSMNLNHMTSTSRSKLNNSKNNSINSRTEDLQTPSTSLIRRESQNRTYREENSKHQDISKKVLNKESANESEDRSKLNNMESTVPDINKKKITTPKRQTRSSTKPRKKISTSRTEKKDFSTGSDADHSSSASDDPSIVKRKKRTAGKTDSTAYLNQTNESHTSGMNQSGNNESFRMTRSGSRFNLLESPRSVKDSQKSSLNLPNNFLTKTKETMESLKYDKSTNKSPVLLSSKKSISQKGNNTASKSLKSPVRESQDTHNSFDNNENNSEKIEETLKRSKNKSLNRKSESPMSQSNISAPNRSIAQTEDGTKNDETKSDENELPKSKPSILRKLRKSLGTNAFDDILASKSVNDSKTTSVASENVCKDVPRDNNSPAASTTERSDVDFCPDTPSTSNLKMGPVSQSTPYSKKIVLPTSSAMKGISGKNFVTDTFKMVSSVPDQAESSNASQPNKINDTIGNALENKSDTNKDKEKNETITDQNITVHPSVSSNINSVGKKPKIISSIRPHLKISRITKKQTVPNKDTDETCRQILQDKDKMAEINKALENIKKRELEKMDRYLTKIPADQTSKSIVPNKKPLQLKNKESRKKATQVNNAYLVNGKVYKRTKLPRPKSWATNHLYEYLWKRLEPKYKLNTRIRSEKFVLQLADVVSLTIRRKKYENYREEVDALMNDMARLGIIKTRNDFYDFCYDFLPYEFRVKATPILLPGNVMSIPYDPKLLHTPILNN